MFNELTGCQALRSQIEQFAKGAALPPGEIQMLEEHVAYCERCSDVVAEERRDLVTRLKSSGRSADAGNEGARDCESTTEPVQRMDSNSREGGAQTLERFTPIRKACSASALVRPVFLSISLVVALLVVLAFSRRPERRRTDAEPSPLTASRSKAVVTPRTNPSLPPIASAVTESVHLRPHTRAVAKVHSDRSLPAKTLRPLSGLPKLAGVKKLRPTILRMAPAPGSKAGVPKRTVPSPVSSQHPAPVVVDPRSNELSDPFKQPIKD